MRKAGTHVAPGINQCVDVDAFDKFSKERPKLFLNRSRKMGLENGYCDLVMVTVSKQFLYLRSVEELYAFHHK